MELSTTKGVIPFKLPAIYGIQNLITGRMYVGSTVDLFKRLNEHFNSLTADRHHNPFLQKSWNLYGQECFNPVILELVSEPNLLVREQFHLDACPSTYNICTVVERPFCSPLQRAKLTAANIRTWKDPVIRERRLAGMRGSIVHSPEGLVRIAAAHKGTKHTPETCTKISLKGKGRPKTEEHKAKIREANKRTWSSPALLQRHADLTRERKRLAKQL